MYRPMIPTHMYWPHMYRPMIPTHMYWPHMYRPMIPTHMYWPHMYRPVIPTHVQAYDTHTFTGHTCTGLWYPHMYWPNDTHTCTGHTCTGLAPMIPTHVLATHVQAYDPGVNCSSDDSEQELNNFKVNSSYPVKQQYLTQYLTASFRQTSLFEINITVIYWSQCMYLWFAQDACSSVGSPFENKEIFHWDGFTHNRLETGGGPQADNPTASKNKTGGRTQKTGVSSISQACVNGMLNCCSFVLLCRLVCVVE